MGKRKIETHRNVFGVLVIMIYRNWLVVLKNKIMRNEDEYEACPANITERQGTIRRCRVDLQHKHSLLIGVLTREMHREAFVYGHYVSRCASSSREVVLP
jgi:hypothetical protein